MHTTQSSYKVLTNRDIYISTLFSFSYSSPGIWNYNNSWKTSRFSADIIEPVNKILGIKYDLKGKENIDESKAYVVVCNHQSSLDVLAVLQVINISFGNVAPESWSTVTIWITNIQILETFEICAF